MSASPSNVPADDNTLRTRDQLEMDRLKEENKKLQLENEKLTLELKKLNAPQHWTAHVQSFLPILTALLAVAGFWFGMWQYINTEREKHQQQITADQNRLLQQKKADDDRLEQQKKADETFRLDLKRETARPFWEKQLALYIEAAEKAAVIATTDDDVLRLDAERRFWVLYYGPLACVEDVGLEVKTARITGAMVHFKDAIMEDAKKRNKGDLKILSLSLARAVRDSIGPAFDLKPADQQELLDKKH